MSRLDSLILFVTSRCNSLCRTCFYFDQLNSRDDLTVDQIARISATAGPVWKLWLSGGEPFLRPELADIVEMFARNNGVQEVNLPTNGLLPAKIFPAVDRMLELAPKAAIDLNFSLDGLANTHDAIRGVPNNFVRTMETIREAEERYAGVRRLRVNVLTVITSENYREVLRLGLDLLEQRKIDGHYFEVVRGETPDPSLKALDAEELKALHRRLMPLHRRYAERLFAHLPPGPRHLARMYYLGTLKLHFDLHEANFHGPAWWPTSCSAGTGSMVIDHNGRFRACELRPVVGSLADFGYDLQTARQSASMKAEAAAIARDRCWCTHSCFIRDSSRRSLRVQLFSVPWRWMKQKWERFDGVTGEEMERFRALEMG